MSVHLLLGLIGALVLLVGLRLGAELPAIRRLTNLGGDWTAALAPRFFALSTFLAGAILLFSGATPARAGRLGWINDVLPLPLVEASAYFASIAGVGLILLARGLQRRLDAAYHLTVWMLAGGIAFALASALDLEQAIVLSLMLAVLLPSRRFFYRKASIFEERFTRGWVAAIAVVLIGATVLIVVDYGRAQLHSDVFWRFGDEAQGPRAVRALTLAVIALMGFSAVRLFRPARLEAPLPVAGDLADAERIVSSADRASAHLAFLGDKALMFNEARTAFVMYAISGQSWVALGDPVGPIKESVQLIDQFIQQADRSGAWPVFYRASTPFLHLYLDYALAVVKLGEVARVSLPDFSLEGPKRRNLRRVWRKAVDEGCTFEVIRNQVLREALPTLRSVSDDWLRSKRTREKRFSLGRFDESFVMRSAVGVIRIAGEIVAFVTLWESGAKAEVEVDLMRYRATAPSGIMRYALIEAMQWARSEGYAWFGLGAAPLSGIRVSSVAPIWNQMAVAVRGAGERYYNFQGLRDFKEWFYPEWEPTYLVSPGGAKRPFVLASISALISGSVRGVIRK